MVCTLPATGPCTVPANAPGYEPKSYNPAIPLPTNLFYQGHDDGFTVTWDNVNPTNYVGIYYRGPDLAAIFAPSAVLESVGTFTVVGLPYEARYGVAVRGETDTEYGDWVIVLVLTDNNWDSDANDVLYGLEFVLYGTEAVLHS